MNFNKDKDDIFIKRLDIRGGYSEEYILNYVKNTYDRKRIIHAVMRNISLSLSLKIKAIKIKLIELYHDKIIDGSLIYICYLLYPIQPSLLITILKYVSSQDCIVNAVAKIIKYKIHGMSIKVSNMVLNMILNNKVLVKYNLTKLSLDYIRRGDICVDKTLCLLMHPKAIVTANDIKEIMRLFISAPIQKPEAFEFLLSRYDFTSDELKNYPHNSDQLLLPRAVSTYNTLLRKIKVSGFEYGRIQRILYIIACQFPEAVCVGRICIDWDEDFAVSKNIQLVKFFPTAIQRKFACIILMIKRKFRYIDKHMIMRIFKLMAIEYINPKKLQEQKRLKKRKLIKERSFIYPVYHHTSVF